jgi:hypothetical protein
MTTHLSYLAANERAGDMRRAAAKAHLAATTNMPKEHPRSVRQPRPAWWQLHRRLTTT